MPSPRTCRARRVLRCRAAFSLVEVCLALGIVSFALLSVVGLMPVGLSAMRQAMDQTTEAQIARTISGEAALVPFDELDQYAAKGPYYFTQEGTRQDSKGDVTRFAVSLTRIDTKFPGSSNAPNLSNNIATFRVETARLAGSAEVARSTNVISIPFSGDSKY